MVVKNFYEMISHSKPHITEEDIYAVKTVLESGMITKGRKVNEFEKQISDYIGTKKTFATGNGTTALILALKALGVKKDDEVILPTYVCRNVMDAVIAVNAIPVVCDIGEFWNMESENVTKKITSRTKAIIVVHIFGITADTYSLMNFGIPVIEDCCQSFGAELNGKKTGSIGTLSMFSFHATKCLTTGEGGAVSSNDENLIDRLSELNNKNYFSSTMSDLQAALGISQLNRYSQMLLERKKIAENYFDNISNPLLSLPTSLKEKSIFFRFPIKTVQLDFEMTRNYFEKNGIHVRRGVDALLHRIREIDDSEFPAATRLFNETLSIPIYPSLTSDEQAHTCRILNGLPSIETAQ